MNDINITASKGNALRLGAFFSIYVHRTYSYIWYTNSTVINGMTIPGSKRISTIDESKDFTIENVTFSNLKINYKK